MHFHWNSGTFWGTPKSSGTVLNEDYTVPLQACVHHIIKHKLYNKKQQKHRKTPNTKADALYYVLSCCTMIYICTKHNLTRFWWLHTGTKQAFIYWPPTCIRNVPLSPAPRCFWNKTNLCYFQLPFVTSQWEKTKKNSYSETQSTSVVLKGVIKYKLLSALDQPTYWYISLFNL